MNARYFLLFSILLWSGQCVAQTSVQKPNVIIILADDLGWGDLGFHGSEIRTPNIDKLAREGMLLNRFYTAPVCSPTRAGLLTGRYPNRFGLRETVIPPWSNFGVDVNEKFISTFFKEAGYEQRVALGKWHLGHAKRDFLPLQRGFTHFYGHYNGAIDYFSHQREGELDWHNDEQTSLDTGYSTDLISDEAVREIKKVNDKPFFMYVAYNAPHTPLQAKKSDLLRYGYDANKPVFGAKGEDGSVSTIGRGNTERQTYSAMVTCMDRGIGRILATLKEMKIDENTIVLFFSDNGAAPGGGGSSGVLRGNKFQEWDGGVRSPAIIKWPKMIDAGSQNNQLMGYIDVLPTLMGIVKSKPIISKTIDGRDFSEVLLSPQKTIERELYLGYGSLISGKWKIVLATGVNKAMKNTSGSLFDIVNDPEEKHDIKDKEPGVFERLTKITQAYDKITSGFSVPPYAQGRKNFKAPKDWLIKD